MITPIAATCSGPPGIRRIPLSVDAESVAAIADLRLSLVLQLGWRPTDGSDEHTLMVAKGFRVDQAKLPGEYGVVADFGMYIEWNVGGVKRGVLIEQPADSPVPSAGQRLRPVPEKAVMNQK